MPTSASGVAALGAKVAPIERDLLGGDCPNVGCVPSKAIIRTSRLYAEMRDAEQYGARTPADIRVDFAAVMERMHGIRARISRADSVHRLIASGVDVFFGQACFTGADALTVDGLRLRFKKALIATGARLDTQSIPGLVEAGYLTNEYVFDLSELPQAFRRFGAQTVVVQDKPLFLRREERDAAQLLCPMPSRAMGSRYGSTPGPSTCAWKAGRRSSIWSATTTRARPRSMPSSPAPATYPMSRDSIWKPRVLTATLRWGQRFPTDQQSANLRRR